ncbi:hypothetical protein I4I73_28660, partial [Pseudonocardia sp. KRD-184]|nr:hypothetical protein [Pseudonocardia oceani]MBW0099960.1 hypothetical protein [Pseudonocardia oceani]
VRSSYRAGRLYAQTVTARGAVLPLALAHLAAEGAGTQEARTLLAATVGVHDVPRRLGNT